MHSPNKITKQVITLLTKYGFATLSPITEGVDYDIKKYKPRLFSDFLSK